MNEPPLTTVTKMGQVIENVQRFNEAAKGDPDGLRALVRQTSLWILDESTGLFGPNKWCGFVGMDAATYRDASQHGSTGAIFDGHIARRAIEQATEVKYGIKKSLKPRLHEWANRLFGSDALMELDESKWKFLSLQNQELMAVNRRHQRSTAQQPKLPNPGAVYPDHQPTADPRELDDRVARLRAQGPIPRPKGESTPRSSLRKEDAYLRLPAVKAFVLQQAGGRCELCQNPAPFATASGEEYLEVHHVRQLAHGGPDTVENAVALCPNCHRRLHFGSDADQLREDLYCRIDRLQRP